VDMPKFGYRIVKKTYGDGRVWFHVERKDSDRDGVLWRNLTQFNTEKSAEDHIHDLTKGLVISSILIREY